MARSEAAERLKNQLKIGSAIRDQRVRDMWELNHARAEKQEWVSRNAALLNELFNQPEPVEYWLTSVLEVSLTVKPSTLR